MSNSITFTCRESFVSMFLPRGSDQFDESLPNINNISSDDDRSPETLGLAPRMRGEMMAGRTPEKSEKKKSKNYPHRQTLGKLLTTRSILRDRTNTSSARFPAPSRSKTFEAHYFKFKRTDDIVADAQRGTIPFLKDRHPLPRVDSAMDWLLGAR